MEGEDDGYEDDWAEPEASFSDYEDEEDDGDDFAPPPASKKRARPASLEPPAPGPGSRKNAFSMLTQAPKEKKKKPRQKKKQEAPEAHPAETPPADGKCYFFSVVNADARRYIISHLDRLSITRLGLTCRRARELIRSNEMLRGLLIPLTARPNLRCVYCHRACRSGNRHFSTCEMGHEVNVHHQCFKNRIVHHWHNNLANASCPIESCGMPLVEYGKSAEQYKKGAGARKGVLKSLFKSAGRNPFMGRFHRRVMFLHAGLGGDGPGDCTIA